ncbi:MAG TPA: YdcF family protein [Ramlibacter sp.]|nr:YdcF family protein [Ramlibacter sp.]
MFELAKIAGYLISPLTVALGLGLLAWLLFAMRRRRACLVFAMLGFATLWIASLPVVADALSSPLDERYPAVTVEATPSADAILVLGGALIAPSPPRRPMFSLGPAAGRVWHTAALFRAGKARMVVISGGNQPGYEGDPSEADAIAQMLVVLGVPEAAILREGRSRNTRENAMYVRPLLQSQGAGTVLLVTSAQHMPRALKTFEKVWGESGTKLVPIPTDIPVRPVEQSLNLWLPSQDALGGVTKALKEYAGIVGLGMI